MAFKIRKKLVTAIKDPESLFRDLRDRTVEGLLAQQADMLRKYMNNMEKMDIALELPTGSGKTLVGLLIAEWRRRSKQERCLMLCPTKQLVCQMVEQAKEKYGIKALDFSGSKYQYSEDNKTAFRNCESIGVATYSGLFNINPFFDDVHTIVFDDAHAAENYVSNLWSLEIQRYKDEEAFDLIWNIISPFVSESDQLFYEKANEGKIDTSFVNKLPVPYLIECKKALLTTIDNITNDNEEYSFKWTMIRERLHACHLYYSSNTILIRPLIVPTKSFAPFQNAKQRIYMSATLGEGGDLERIFGRKKIERLTAPEGWDKQGIGRRFFVFPMRMWDEKTSLDYAVSWANKFDRTLILAPSNRDAEAVREIIMRNEATQNFKLFDAKQLETTKKMFIKERSAIAVLANRYDGIDLIGDECRYLIIYGLPEATNLQERFIMTRLGASILFEVRVRTRITQAVGRCTRSSTDYALVAVIGDKVHNYFHTPEKRQALHPEMQSEVVFGVEQAKVENLSELIENIDIFITHGDDWKEADNHILETRDELDQQNIPSADNLGNSVAYEVKFHDDLWNCNYERAISSAKDVLREITGGQKLKGYSALWNYLAGSAAYLAGQTEIAKEHFSAAFACASSLPWLKQIQEFISVQTNVISTDTVSPERIEYIELILERFGKSSSNKITKYFQNIREGLSSNEAKPFEDAQVELGKLLGFVSGNTENSGDPDPWWVFDKRGIVFEDYTATGDNPIISKSKTLQAKAHPDTLASQHPEVTFSVVMCSTSEKLHAAAAPHAAGIFYISVQEFINFSEECMVAIRSLWDTFSSQGDIDWRESAARKLIEAKLSNEDIFSRLTCNKLSSLAGDDQS